MNINQLPLNSTQYYKIQCSRSFLNTKKVDKYFSKLNRLFDWLFLMLLQPINPNFGPMCDCEKDRKK